MKKKNCLIIFVKSPVPGKVKTRLCPELSLEEACHVYQDFIRVILARALRLPVSQRVIAWTGQIQPLRDMANRNFKFLPQGSGNLEKRLHRVFDWARGYGFLRTVVMGSDSPSLPLSYISKAFSMLEKQDLVLGPAWDGGYYLIGTRSASLDLLFRGVTWSVAQTLIHTILNAKRLNLSIGILPAWYDVDTYDDLRFLWLDEWVGGKNFK